MIFENLNATTLTIFAPILVLIGILGFIIPPNKSLTSGAPWYNVFHIAFGVIGIAAMLSNSVTAIKTFNIVFGLIDLYQAVASVANLFPKRFFRWTRVDDVLHLLVGIALVVIGVFGR